MAAWERFHTFWLVLRCKGFGARTEKSPLQAGNSPELTTSNKVGTSVSQPQETEFCQQPKSAENKLSH